MNYRDLLKKYMTTVCDLEGVTYVRECHPGDTYEPHYSQEEVNELQAIETELIEDWNK